MTFVPDIDSIEFVDEVPAKESPFPPSQWLPVIERVKAANTAQRENGHAVQPAVVGRFDDAVEANRVANNLRAVTKKRGNWDVTMRNKAVYLKFLGD